MPTSLKELEVELYEALARIRASGGVRSAELTEALRMVTGAKDYGGPEEYLLELEDALEAALKQTTN